MTNMDPNKLKIAVMFRSVEKVVGIHVMLLVTEHALWKTKGKYEDAALISFSEEGICLDALDGLTPERSQVIINEFVVALTATLGRLVGKQLAMQITEQFSAKTDQIRGA